MRPVAGHTFLARLGKRRLRPGGKEATDWLLGHIKDEKRLKALEVACNQGTTSFELVKQFNLDLIACDLSDEALAIANANNQTNSIQFVKADARNLPFEDESFDIVINEAMLTMLSDEDKKLALKEYYRVLKPRGMVLTHDVVYKINDEKQQELIRQEMTRTILANVKPHTEAGWVSFFEDTGFETTVIVGDMSLLNPKGLIKDEGIINTLRIIKNALKRSNRSRFRALFKLFKKYDKAIGYIAIVGRK